MASELERCAIKARVHGRKDHEATNRIDASTVRLLCAGCSHDHRHRRCKVTLRYRPTADFVLLVHMNNTNEEVEQIFFLPVQNIREHQFLRPSTRA
jgi:hypothetical protein